MAQKADLKEGATAVGYYVHRYGKKGKWILEYDTTRKGARIRRTIPWEEARSLGLTPDLPYEAAKSMAGHLNAKERHSRRTESKQTIMVRLEREAEERARSLPAALISLFETEVLMRRKGWSDSPEHQRFFTHWRAAQKALHEIGLDFDELAKKPDVFWDYCQHKRISFAYLDKILRLINKWGEWLAQRKGVYFKPVARPKGRERQRIEDAYWEKARAGKQSVKLTPALIQSAAQHFPTPQLNWLKVSLWFGLRPQEVNLLLTEDAEFWFIEDNALWVYQPKVSSRPRNERWKRIPAIHPEQLECLQLIRDKQIGRAPLVKTLKKYLDPKLNRYGGRKGFHPIMNERGHSLEEIAGWMGHAHFETLWRYYRDRPKKVG